MMKITSMSAMVMMAVMLMVMVEGRFKSAYDKLHPKPSSPLSAPVQYFSQKLDHFDPINTQTWKQRYTVDSSSSQKGSPVFFFLSGEAPMEFFEFQEVQAKNWAKEFNATYVVLEHRFYGESVPTADFSTNNLKYLTSHQALADAAYFMEYMADQGYPTPWVVFGCSYSGGLSAWMRGKYPNLVLASVAPSGPVQATLNYSQYYGQFSQSAAPSCVAAAKNATSQIIDILSESDGLSKLSKIFRSCDEIKEEDVYMFKYTITSALGGADQMSNPPDWTLNQTCDMLTSSSDLVNNWASIVLNGTDDCMDYSLSGFLSALKETETSQQTGDRAWTWQTCVEFGYFSTSYPGTSVFFPDIDVETQVGWCSAAFGIDNMTPDIQGTNDYYGGFNVSGSNIMFTNGLLDPWHLLSVNHDFADGDVLSATYLAGHCGTLIEASSIDPPSLTAARERVRQFLEKSLK